VGKRRDVKVEKRDALDDYDVDSKTAEVVLGRCVSREGGVVEQGKESTCSTFAPNGSPGFAQSLILTSSILHAALPTV